MLRRLLSFILFFNIVSAQSFFYSYIDPCEQTVINSTYDVNASQQGFQVTYYNKTKFFTLEEVLNGDLEVWAQNVYKDFEDLFPCAVKVAEEILSSVIAENVSEQFSKEEDISTEPQQINYAIRSTTKDNQNWITSFNSVYTAESFDGARRHDGNFNFTNDWRKGSLTYGQGFNLKAKKQNVVLNGSGLTYKTFEGWDWLISTSYAKSLQKKNAEAFVFTATYGKVSSNNFGNITMVYGQRFPFEVMGGNKITISNYMAYTLVRYYEGNNLGDRYLLLKSPLIFFPTISVDWKLGQAFTFNLGLSMGYNTVVNDYGKRNKSFSLMFGTYF